VSRWEQGGGVRADISNIRVAEYTALREEI
jgi:hypothetical protein